MNSMFERIIRLVCLVIGPLFVASSLVAITAPVQASTPDKAPVAQVQAAQQVVPAQSVTKRVTKRQADKAAADSDNTCKNGVASTDTSIHLTACVYAEASDKVVVHDKVRAEVEGRTQVSWMRPDTAVQITPEAVKNAPVVHVTPKTTSAQLYKMTGGARVVRVIGKWLNNGRLGNIVAGFVTNSPAPGASMVMRKGSTKYEHGAVLWTDTPANRAQAKAEGRKIYGRVLIGGTWYIIAQSCLNDFHGHFQTMVVNPIQVKTEDEVTFEQEVEDQSKGSITVYGEKTCPSGDVLRGSITLSASAATSILVREKLYVLAQAVGDAAALAKGSAAVKAKANGEANAAGEITLTCGTGGSTHDNPLVEVNAPAHVVINPNEVDATAHIWARVKASDGATVSVQTPQVTPQNMGTVSEWMMTGTDSDGWITYAGTFHASGLDGQVCFTVKVTDSKGGSATSDPACSQVVHDGGADV